MVLNEAAVIERKTLTVAEVTAIYKMELNAELGLTIRDYTVPSPDLPTLCRARSVYVEAYGWLSGYRTGPQRFRPTNANGWSERVGAPGTSKPSGVWWCPTQSRPTLCERLTIG